MGSFMGKGWRQRLRRGRLGWLGRIDGVEKPAVLLGLGLVLYRVWRTQDPARPVSRWRSALTRLSQQLSRGFRSPEAQPPVVEDPDPPAPQPESTPTPPSPRP